MLSRRKRRIQEAIRFYCPSFYWGQKPKDGIIENITRGYVESKPWWKRFFQRRKIKNQTLILEMVLHYWLYTLPPEEYVHYKSISKIRAKKIYKEFLRLINTTEERGVFEDMYVWDVYLVLMRYNLVRKEVYEKYQGIKW